MSIQVVVSSTVLVGMTMSLLVVVVRVAVLPRLPPSTPPSEQYPPGTHVWPERQ